MDERVCAAAIWVLAAVLAFRALPERPGPTRADCPDPWRLAVEAEEEARGRLPLLLCPDGIGERAASLPRGAAGLLLGRPIDLNEATEEELQALPGIGPGLARRLLEDRERNGPFRSVDEVARVRGLGTARVAALRGLTTAGAR